MAKRKTSLPSEKVKDRLIKTLREQEKARQALIATLRDIKRVVNEASDDDLEGSLEAIKQATDLIRQAQGKIEDGVGHMDEELETLKADIPGQDVRNIATVLVNEKEFVRYDPDTIAAFLEIADPQILAEVLHSTNALREKVKKALTRHGN